MTVLAKGSNASLDSRQIVFALIASPVDIDLMALSLQSNQHVSGDGDFVFYNQPTMSNGSVQLLSDGVHLNFDRISPAIQSILVLGYCHGTSFAEVSSMTAQAGGVTLTYDNLDPVDIMILAEFYRHQGAWKVRNINQGYAGGLAALATNHGVSVDAEPVLPASPPSVVAPPPSPHISLIKTGDSATVAAKSGYLTFRLTWKNPLTKQPPDLDIVSFYKLKRGLGKVMQPLEKNYGSLVSPPYMELDQDDRTGLANGETWRLNMSHSDEVAEIVLAVWNYSQYKRSQGHPAIPDYNWHELKAVAVFEQPNGPDIRIDFSAYDTTQPMCAVVHVVGHNGVLTITREIRFFDGHPELDQHYGWGIAWVPRQKSD